MEELRIDLSKLTARERRVVVALFQKGVSIELVAAEEKVGVKAIYERLRQAEDKLGRQLPRQTNRGRPSQRFQAEPVLN